jgi:orotidine-5'-phosphate decarboxylase
VSSDRYLELLGRRSATVHSCLCLGLDPDPGSFPDGFGRDVEGLEQFAGLLLDAALPHAAAVKANLAFFEAFGSAGSAALERLRARVPADVPFIADAKRSDIGPTAARQAVAIFDALGADALTANPYLGQDALEPFLARTDRFVYVLCRTSNPGAGELQDLDVGGEPLYLHVAWRAAEWARASANVGLVVGATAAAELARVRRMAPALPFLVPGVGAQGGEQAAVLQDGPAESGRAAGYFGGGLLVNVSRGISAAATNAADPGAALALAAQSWSEKLRVIGWSDT